MKTFLLIAKARWFRLDDLTRDAILWGAICLGGVPPSSTSSAEDTDMTWKDMSDADRLDARLAEIDYLISTAWYLLRPSVLPQLRE